MSRNHSHCLPKFGRRGRDKARAAYEWVKHPNGLASEGDGQPWRYALIRGLHTVSVTAGASKLGAEPRSVVIT